MGCCQKEVQQPNCYMIGLPIMIQKMNNQNENVHSLTIHKSELIMQVSQDLKTT
jgi:hypothetical protein